MHEFVYAIVHSFSSISWKEGISFCSSFDRVLASSTGWATHGILAVWGKLRTPTPASQHLRPSVPSCIQSGKTLREFQLVLSSLEAAVLLVSNLDFIIPNVFINFLLNQIIVINISLLLFEHPFMMNYSLVISSSLCSHSFFSMMLSLIKAVVSLGLFTLVTNSTSVSYFMSVCILHCV